MINCIPDNLKSKITLIFFNLDSYLWGGTLKPHNKSLIYLTTTYKNTQNKFPNREYINSNNKNIFKERN